MRKSPVRAIVPTALAVLCVGLLTGAAAAADCPKAPEKFTTLCASCHGSMGKGNGPAAEALKAIAQVRDFTNAEYMKTRTDAQLINVIKNGGPAEKLNPLMAAMGPQFSGDKEIQEIVKFIRALPKAEAKCFKQ